MLRNTSVDALFAKHHLNLLLCIANQQKTQYALSDGQAYGLVTVSLCTLPLDAVVVDKLSQARDRACKISELHRSSNATELKGIVTITTTNIVSG
jgi:hypothetical protein